MLWRQMGVPHCHRKALVPQDLLQSQDVSAVHYEMAGEGMPQDMRQLADRQF
jgi:hypothetical protein